MTSMRVNSSLPLYMVKTVNPAIYNVKKLSANVCGVVISYPRNERATAVLPDIFSRKNINVS